MIFDAQSIFFPNKNQYLITTYHSIFKTVLIILKKYHDQTHGQHVYPGSVSQSDQG